MWVLETQKVGQMAKIYFWYPHPTSVSGKPTNIPQLGHVNWSCHTLPNIQKHDCVFPQNLMALCVFAPEKGAVCHMYESVLPSWLHALEILVFWLIVKRKKPAERGRIETLEKKEKLGSESFRNQERQGTGPNWNGLCSAWNPQAVGISLKLPQKPATPPIWSITSDLEIKWMYLSRTLFKAISISNSFNLFVH